MYSVEKPFSLQIREIATNGRRRDAERLLELPDGLESPFSQGPQNRDATISDMHSTEGIRFHPANQSFSLRMNVIAESWKIFRYIIKDP
jgi:hypothetical protein